jgi:hypothetical protein
MTTTMTGTILNCVDDQRGPMKTHHRWLVPASFVLGAGTAINSLLGPIGFDVIRYHYGESMINQAIGLDAVAVVLAAPLAIVAGLLIAKGHRAGPALLFAPATFAAYMMPQYIIGPDYLQLPGNNENFILFHIGLFILATTILVGAWNAIDRDQLRPNLRRSDQRRACVLLALAAFIAFGRWLPGIADALKHPPANKSYLDNPTAFWVVGFLDLGVVVPVAIVTSMALLRGSPWARSAAYAVIGWFSLVPASVAAMAMVMEANADPLGTAANTATMITAAVVLSTGAIAMYRPLFHRSAKPHME